MRTTDTLTISLPPAMAKQMEKVQKEENRTRSEQLREAWRQYFLSRHYPVYTPSVHPDQSGTGCNQPRPS